MSAAVKTTDTWSEAKPAMLCTLAVDDGSIITIVRCWCSSVWRSRALVSGSASKIPGYTKIGPSEGTR
jgi:hypothetical protein